LLEVFFFHHCVTTEIATDESKIKYKKGFRVATIVIIGNYGKPQKGGRSTKIEFGVRELITCRKVLAPYNAHPKMIPLIKIQIDVVSFKCLFYKKKIKKK